MCTKGSADQVSADMSVDTRSTYQLSVGCMSVDRYVDTRLGCMSADILASSSTVGRCFTDTLLIGHRDVGDISSFVLGVIFPNKISLFLNSSEIPFKRILF